MTDFSKKLRSMGNLFFLITDAAELKLFAAWADPHPAGNIDFFDTPLIQPIAELENTRAELAALEFIQTSHDLGYGYELILYRAPDVQQSELIIAARFNKWLSALLSEAIDKRNRLS